MGARREGANTGTKTTLRVETAFSITPSGEVRQLPAKAHWAKKGRRKVWVCSSAGSGGGGGAVPADEVCRLTSRRLLELDDIVGEVVAYGGPAAGMILLCSAVNSTVMLYLAITKFSYYYLAYIPLKVLSVVQVTYIPDFLWCKRKESLRLIRRQLTCSLHSPSAEAALKDVEKVVAGSTTFRVCRIFTLDRHIILSVASSVVTYLVIALQFGVSETPGGRRSPAANCSSST